MKTLKPPAPSIMSTVEAHTRVTRTELHTLLTCGWKPCLAWTKGDSIVTTVEALTRSYES